MDCDAYRISCQLEQIVAQMQGFDVNAFYATVVATLLGAGFAAVISVVLYRHEVRVRRRSTIDDAVAALIRAIQRYSQDYRRFLRANAARAGQSALAVQKGWDERVIVPEEPDREEIDTAVEMLVVLTERDERKVASRCRQILYELNFLEDGDAQRVEYASIRRVLVAWRSQKRTVNETLKNLSTIEVRCKFLQQGLEDRLPPSPEPYERSTHQDLLSPFSA